MYSASKIKVVSEKNQDLDLFAQSRDLSLYNKTKINSIDYTDVYLVNKSIVGTKKKIAIYLNSSDTVPQAEFKVEVIAEGQDYPWNKTTEDPEPEPSKFKIEDFELTFESDEYGGTLVYLSCSNPKADEIKGFSIYDSKGSNMFMEKAVDITDAGFTYRAPDMNELYTLKVYGDKEGNTLLFEGKIKFSEGGR